jgi:hypothetical protein
MTKRTEEKQSQENIDRKMAVEILLAYSKEEWEQRRQSENQRSLMTNFILTISSATLLLIINNGLSEDTLPFAIFLIILGLFGAVTVAKLHERGEYHIESTKAWRDKVNQLYPEAELLELRKNAGKAHEKKFGNMLQKRIRLHSLWMYFNLAITALGIGLAIYILVTT